MDMTESIAPRSDQVNADDLVGGPITYTIREVVKGKAEQPFDFLLVETNRAYRPSKTMRRVIVSAWGPETSTYAGRRLTLYREPTIKFGNVQVGGIRISHLSHIDGKRDVMLQVTRGKRENFSVQPLAAHVQQERADTQPVERMTAKTRAHMFALFNELGINEDDQRAGIALIVDHPIESRGDLTETEAQQVLTRLRVKKAEQDAGADAVEPDLFEREA
jgi:hypothetical protein